MCGGEVLGYVKQNIFLHKKGSGGICIGFFLIPFGLKFLLILTQFHIALVPPRWYF